MVMYNVNTGACFVSTVKRFSFFIITFSTYSLTNHIVITFLALIVTLILTFVIVGEA